MSAPVALSIPAPEAAVVWKTLQPPTATSTSADFDAADSAEMNNIINWSKGIDLEDADNDDPSDITDIRPNVHGDVIHSQPVVINYGGSERALCVLRLQRWHVPRSEGRRY